MGFIQRLLHAIFVGLLFRYVRRVACLHYCKFKQAGSDMKYTHVHVLFPTERGYTGVGHDDETNHDHPHHNTLSREDSCEFETRSGLGLPRPFGDHGGGPPIQTIYASDFGKPMMDVYFTSPPEDPQQPCPPGFTRVTCECGDMCVTFSHETWQQWYDTLPH